MELYIKGAGIDDGFIEFIIKRIFPSRLLSILDERKLSAWDEYLFEEKKGNFNLGNLKSTKDVIKCGISNLTYTTYGGDYIIRISDVAVISGTMTKILPVCKLIEYGNTEIAGYPIFSKVIDKIKSELELYHNMYEMGMR